MTSPHRSLFTSTPPRRQSSHRPRFARNWRGFALGVAALTVTTTLLAQDSIVTNASWTDEEWVHGQVGTVKCGETTDAFVTQSTGKALGGSILGIDLDTLAEVSGVTTVNEAGTATSTGGTQVTGLPDAWADPLDVVALSAVELGLTDLLELPLDTPTGAVNQFAQATGSGLAHGASGYVNDSGGIDLPGAEGDYPQLATLKLSEVLNSDLLGGLGLAETLANVTDLELEVGAVAGRAELDTCASLWAPQVQALANSIANEAVPGLSREYLATSADLVFTSPTVGALVTAIGGTPDAECDDEDISVITGLECTVDGLASNESVLSSLTTGITDLLGTLTDGLGLGSIDLALTATVDTSGVQSLLVDTLDDGVVSISLTSGEIRIDAAALLESAYPETYSYGLNGLAPNTNPLADPQVLDTLISGITTMLSSWISVVESTLDAVIDSVRINLLVDIHLTLSVWSLTTGTRIIEIGHIAVQVDCSTGDPGCTLGELLDPTPGQQQVHADFVLLPGLGAIPILGPILMGLINGVVGGLISGLVEVLVSGVGALLGSTVESVLGVLRVVPPAVSGLTTPIIDTVSRLYTGLFLDDVLAITINAQNLTPAVDDEPPEWTDNTVGPYEVSAIRVGILDALEEFAVYLHLGRASVGPGCSANNTNSECPRIHASGN